MTMNGNRKMRAPAWTRRRVPVWALRGALTMTVALAALLAGCSGRGPAHVPAPAADTHRVGDLAVAMSSDPALPRLGDNELVIDVRDAGGQPVKGARIRPVISMEAMGAMPRMESRGTARQVAPGLYRTGYSLGMKGEWDVTVHIDAPGHGPVIANYRLSTSVQGLDFAGGTPAVGSPAGAAAPAGGGAGATGGNSAATGSNVPGTRASVPPAGASDSAAVLVDTRLRQSLGVRTEPVQLRDLTASLRAPGRVVSDEKRAAEVSLKFAGWVRDLRVDFTGSPVRAGQVLFTVYSPELYAAQQEFLEALRLARADTLQGSAGRAGEAEIADAARRRLLLWDIRPSQIQQIERAGRAQEALPILSPVSGVVMEKSVVRGSAFTAGQMLYRIVPLDPIWIQATVQQSELPLIRPGMQARILNPFVDERSRFGRVAFVSPSLTTDTRTGEARIEVRNPGGALKPGMFVDVEMVAPLPNRLSVPASAVIFSGQRRVVFVDLGDGRLSPREVRLGRRAGDYYEVLAGVGRQDRVVTSGNFLVASESQLKAALERWEGDGPHD